MHQAMAYFNQHGATFTLGQQVYELKTFDTSPPCPALLLTDARGTELFAFPIRVIGRPNAEAWEIRKPAGKSLKRVAAFYIDDGRLVTL